MLVCFSNVVTAHADVKCCIALLLPALLFVHKDRCFACKTVVLFVFDSFKPLDHGYCVFPLVECGCSRDFVVVSVEDCFAE